MRKEDEAAAYTTRHSQIDNKADRLFSGQGGVSIIGVGGCVPDTVLKNDDLTRLVDTNDEWIASRSGIRERHIVSGDESLGDLAIKASQDALKSAGMDGADIDLIIVATSTSETIYPAVSCQIQHALNATHAAGFDLSLACSGFIYAMVTAYQYLKNGMFRNALVVGGDILSRQVDWTDRNTCVLFGDGAGAVVLQATPGEENFLACDLHMDGSKKMELTLFAATQNCPLVSPRSAHSPYIYMNGREMFKFAVGAVPKTISETIHAAGLTNDQIDYIVLHQANVRIMQAMSEKLNFPMEKMLISMDKYGNTSSASIPLALNDASLSAKIKKGDILVLCGFGAGAAWGTSIVRWACVDRRLKPSREESSEIKSVAVESVKDAQHLCC